MTPEQLLIVFYGVEAVALLFGLYGLYELALYLLGRVKAGTMTLSKAQTCFGIPAMLMAFLPFAILSFTIRNQPESVKLFDVSDARTIFLMFGALFAGFVIQGITIGIFWFFTRSLRK